METFVVRVFIPAGDERTELTGIVEHVATGSARAFRGPSDLIAVVLLELGGDGGSEPASASLGIGEEQPRRR